MPTKPKEEPINPGKKKSQKQSNSSPSIKKGVDQTRRNIFLGLGAVGLFATAGVVLHNMPDSQNERGEKFGNPDEMSKYVTFDSSIEPKYHPRIANAVAQYQKVYPVQLPITIKSMAVEVDEKGVGLERAEHGVIYLSDVAKQCPEIVLHAMTHASAPRGSKLLDVPGAPNGYSVAGFNLFEGQLVQYGYTRGWGSIEESAAEYLRRSLPGQENVTLRDIDSFGKYSRGYELMKYIAERFDISASDIHGMIKGSDLVGFVRRITSSDPTWVQVNGLKNIFDNYSQGRVLLQMCKDALESGLIPRH